MSPPCARPARSSATARRRDHPGDPARRARPAVRPQEQFKAPLGLAGTQRADDVRPARPGQGARARDRGAARDRRAASRHVLYRIVGATHPNLVAREGEAYRERLQALRRASSASPTTSRGTTASSRPTSCSTSSRPATSTSRPISTSSSRPRARSAMRSRWARRWSRRPTSTPANCWPTASACWSSPTRADGDRRRGDRACSTIRPSCWRMQRRAYASAAARRSGRASPTAPPR